MGLALWHYLRPEPGVIVPIARAKALRFIDEKKVLLPPPREHIDLALFVVELVDRRFDRLLRVELTRFPLNEDGTPNMQLMMQLAVNSMPPFDPSRYGNLFPDREPPPPNLVNAAHLFARRRSDRLTRWKPTPDEAAQLRTLVNKRAGRVVV